MVAQFSYSKILNSSLSVSPTEGAVIRHQMSDGYSAQTDRFTNNFIQYSLDYLMTASEYTAFLAWWKTNKAVMFDFVDPIDDQTYDSRIVDGVFTATPMSSKQGHFKVTMTIERKLA